jgi:tetratricopeptide (TPR) repeat protein
MALRRTLELMDELEPNMTRRHALALAEELRVELRDSCFLPLGDRVRLEALLRKHELDPSLLPPAWQPSAAETYLPLFSPAASTVARIVVARRDRPGMFGETLSAASLGHARGAFEGLCAALARSGAGVPDALEKGHDVQIEHRNAAHIPIDGPSLGLPLCVAMLSRYLGRAPKTHVAGSAEVTVEGRLRPVGGLPGKVDALLREWPQVRTVVVAREQGSFAAPEGIAIARCDTLHDAWAVFGLCVKEGELREMSRAALRKRVKALELDAVVSYVALEWQRLSAQAAYVGAALRHTDRADAAEAMAWAALFALHAGDEPRAARYLAEITPEDVGRLRPACRVWYQVISASRSIDGPDGPLQAIELAKAALASAEGLSGTDRRDLLGRSYGTLGRALLHAGRYGEALGYLRRGADFHREELPEEAPRSLCTLAICLRLNGQAQDALRMIDEALALASRMPDSESAVTSRLFLRLERGRSHLALGQLEDARDDFLHLAEQQTSDGDYPRLGGLRGLASAHRQLGESDACEAALRRCLDVAESQVHAPVVRRIAAYAAGDALLAATDEAPGMRARLEAAWGVNGPTDVASIAAVLAAAVY